MCCGSARKSSAALRPVGDPGLGAVRLVPRVQALGLRALQVDAGVAAAESQAIGIDAFTDLDMRRKPLWTNGLDNPEKPLRYKLS